MNINRSYLRCAIIAIVVMIGTISAAYAATTPPTIHSVLLDPTEVAPNGSINVTVNVTDESGIASVTADNVSLADAGNDTWAGTITAANTSGTYNVTVVATDASNNSNVATDDSATYTVPEQGDITPPVIHSVLLDPAVVAPNGSINVTVNVTDESGIASVTADGVALTLVVNDTYVGTILAAGTSGTYNVTVVATDNSTNSNNVTDDSATYTIPEQGDTTPPTIHSVLLDPTEVAPNGSINVTVTATDESGIASVTADGVSLADAGNDTWTGTITAANASGTYNVTVVATDNSTNVNNVTDDSATYTVTEPMHPVTLYIEDVATRPGENKAVPITVFGVVDMGGCEINFIYDPTVVYVTDVARGDLNFSFEYNINNGSGWMRANALDVYGQSGNVTFAYVTLAAVGNKSDVSEMRFEDSRLLDVSFGEIAHIRRNGTFSILQNVPPDVTNVSATPATILYDNGRPRSPGTNITSLSAYVTDTDGSITAVTINLSSIGGSPAQPMEHVSGGLWEVTTNATEVAAAINAPDFTHELAITATDDDGGINDSVSIELTVLKRGDVNGDGLVDRMDADHISRYLAGLEPEASNPLVVLAGDVIGDAGDPSGNGVVDLMDALYIARYTSGMVEEP